MSASTNPGRAHAPLARDVRDYPYARWPHVSRHDYQLLNKAVGSLPRTLRSALDEASHLLGALVVVREGPLELWTAAQARAALQKPDVVAVFAREAGAREALVLCGVANALAARLVDRVLGGDGQNAQPVGVELDAISAGVAGYLAARVCAATDAQLRTRALLTDAHGAHALLGDARVVVWPLALELGGRHHGWLRIFIPEASVATLSIAAPHDSGVALMDFMRALPLKLCAHAARVTLTRSQLEALLPGDVIVPERCGLAFEDRSPVGYAELHVLGGRSAGFRCSASGSRLLLDTITSLTPESHDMSQTRRIQQPLAQPELSALAVDAPIELCVELARFSLRLDELSALRPGQVLSTSVPIGESVWLSAAGRPIARGELVELDGEVGVRILELGPQ